MQLVTSVKHVLLPSKLACLDDAAAVLDREVRGASCQGPVRN